MASGLVLRLARRCCYRRDACTADHCRLDSLACDHHAPLRRHAFEHGDIASPVLLLVASIADGIHTFSGSAVSGGRYGAGWLRAWSQVITQSRLLAFWREADRTLNRCDDPSTCRSDPKPSRHETSDDYDRGGHRVGGGAC